MYLVLAVTSTFVPLNRKSIWHHRGSARLQPCDTGALKAEAASAAVDSFSDHRPILDGLFLSRILRVQGSTKQPLNPVQHGEYRIYCRTFLCRGIALVN